MAHHRSTTAITVVATITGLALVASTGRAAAFGATLAAVGALACTLRVVKTWLADTSDEKLRLRIATDKADEARNQAQVAQAIQTGERERNRREVEDIRHDAEQRIAAAEERATQAEINYSQRAREAERDAKEEATQRLFEEIQRMRNEFEKERAALMASQYEQGAMDALDGTLDAILDAPRTVINIDERRPQRPRGQAAGAEH